MAFSALVVCSDAEAVRVLSPILAERGLEVESCADSTLAADRLKARPFAVVLVDCENEPAAIDLMVAARSSSDNKSVLIVAIVDAHNQTRELFAQGANFLLFKPVSAEHVAESLQAAWSLLPSERRGKDRLHVSTQATISYATTADSPTPLLNISEAGAALHSQNNVPPPSRVYLQFSLPGDPSIVRLSGEVVWQDARGQVGVHFTHVPQTSRRALDGWLSRNRAQHVHAEESESSPLILELPRAVVTEAKKLTPAPQLQSHAQSPTQAASGTERRGQSRRSCRLGVNVYGPGGGVLQHCTLTDISSGGCYVETTQPLPAGSSVEIEVRTYDFKLLVRGRVQSKHPGYGMGIEFKVKTPEDRELVDQLLSYQDGPQVGVSAEAFEQI